MTAKVIAYKKWKLSNFSFWVSTPNWRLRRWKYPDHLFITWCSLDGCYILHVIIILCYAIIRCQILYQTIIYICNHTLDYDLQECTITCYTCSKQSYNIVWCTLVHCNDYNTLCITILNSISTRKYILSYPKQHLLKTKPPEPVSIYYHMYYKYECIPHIHISYKCTKGKPNKSKKPKGALTK